VLALDLPPSFCLLNQSIDKPRQDHYIPIHWRNRLRPSASAINSCHPSQCCASGNGNSYVATDFCARSSAGCLYRHWRGDISRLYECAANQSSYCRGLRRSDQHFFSRECSGKSWDPSKDHRYSATTSCTSGICMELTKCLDRVYRDCSTYHCMIPLYWNAFTCHRTD
jgi:hypothetical protein